MTRALLALVRHDLRQHLRDRSMLLFALVIPLSLAFVFSLAFAGLDDLELDPVTVAVAGPEGDQSAAALVGVLQALPEQDLQVTVVDADPDEVAGLVRSGVVGVGVELPEGFAARMASSSAETGVTIRIGAEAGLTGDVVADVVRSTVLRMDADAAALAGAAATSGADGSPLLTGEQLDALAEELAQARPAVGWTERQVSGARLSMTSGIVAGQAGMFLFFTVGFAVLTLLTEREWGTLSRLRTMPMPRWLVPAAKAIVAVLLGVASTSMILLAGTFLLDGVRFGSWWMVLPLVLAVVAAATSVMFVILKVARTAEQASLAMSVVAISLGVGGGTFFRIPVDGRLGQMLQVNPVAALGRGLGITAGGGDLVDLLPVLLTLLAFTAVALLVARVVPGRKDAL